MTLAVDGMTPTRSTRFGVETSVTSLDICARLHGLAVRIIAKRDFETTAKTAEVAKPNAKIEGRERQGIDSTASQHR